LDSGIPRIRDKVEEFNIGPMVLNIKVTGRMIWPMERED